MSPYLRRPLDVCLLNGRNYVQATQMIARVCEGVDAADAVLDQAKFVRLTHHAVGVVCSAPGASDADAIGTVRIRRGAGWDDHQLFELPGLAPARERVPSIRIDDPGNGHSLSGSCEFGGEASLEGVLDALVQGIKQLHESLVPPVHDIWFTSLRGFHLPLRMPHYRGSGRLDVARLRAHSEDGQHQSLMKVRLTLAGIDKPLDGLVSFAYRSGGNHVD